LAFRQNSRFRQTLHRIFLSKSPAVLSFPILVDRRREKLSSESLEKAAEGKMPETEKWTDSG
jgi:hypothetical protein